MKKAALASFAAALLVILLGLGVQPASAQNNRVTLWTGTSPGLGTLRNTIVLDTTRPTNPIHRIYQGNVTGIPETLFNNLHVYNGLNRADARFTFSSDGQTILAGVNETGEELYFLQPVGPFIRVHRGANTTGRILYTITRDRVYEGDNFTGPIVLSATGNLLRADAPIAEIVTLLLQAAPTLN